MAKIMRKSSIECVAREFLESFMGSHGFAIAEAPQTFDRQGQLCVARHSAMIMLTFNSHVMRDGRVFDSAGQVVGCVARVLESFWALIAC